jgi:hypothetical protein
VAVAETLKIPQRCMRQTRADERRAEQDHEAGILKYTIFVLSAETAERTVNNQYTAQLRQVGHDDD